MNSKIVILYIFPEITFSSSYNILSSSLSTYCKARDFEAIKFCVFPKLA